MFQNILSGTAAAGGGMSSIIFLVIIFVVFYFFLIRPENKRKKKLTEMRNSISLGDEIVTIGGIMGKVVQVTEDTITFETGEDRVRLQVTKWAISSNVRVPLRKPLPAPLRPTRRRPRPPARKTASIPALTTRNELI